MKSLLQILLSVVILFGCTSPELYDILIKNGNIVDGSGKAVSLQTKAN